ncbi:Trm112p family protein [Wigglesworthia glossinidia endosymbiont of Glossina morsitans morsitans (Yale colony)]|uniref:UPF0434 protein WIGMOR_0527 n=1 Tax=Wigglesworthia glossinidia endosymbiont of Glossina morsitans morsitans (Yale colony) TaxID=1142511 RepID=H6Q563_WIGGL|nr:Trm112 family protein [Wigglesworthia glossinidia]AFA41346.1 Trm112p family protein [Wigglesworthia glossinidia endosymbiont of Glossina morsitans morsitans (Yale colony)]
MDQKLLNIIACPICYGKLIFCSEKQELICKLDLVAFPIHEGIPILIKNASYSIK